MRTKLKLLASKISALRLGSRVAWVAVILAVGICATVFACRPELWNSIKASAAGALSLAKPTSAAQSSAMENTVSHAAPPSSITPRSSAPVSSAGSSGIDMATAAAQVSLEQAASPLSIDVSIAKQRVTIYDAEHRIVAQYVCSTGEPGSETPTGTYRISDRGKSFYSPSVSEGGYYWTRFQGDYLFHSVPFGKDYKLEPEEAAKLGTPASHGCVRLAMENAKWIYDHIPRGAVVTIR